MKIAIYGGSFNPAHIGHQLVASLVLSTTDIDELWFAPTYKHMLGKDLIDYEHRVEMVRAMAKMFGGRASVTRAEQRLSKRPGFVGSMTIDLVRYLKDEWPNDQFRLIIGSDLIESSKTWENWDEIEKLAPPLVVARAGYHTHNSLPLHQIVLPDVSSTDVKKAMAKGENIRGLVPREVYAYMVTHGLYGTAPVKLCELCRAPYLGEDSVCNWCRNEHRGCY